MKTLYYLQVDNYILGVSQRYTGAFLYFIFTAKEAVKYFIERNRELCKLAKIVPIQIEPSEEGINRIPVKEEKIRIAERVEGGFTFSTWRQFLSRG